MHKAPGESRRQEDSYYRHKIRRNDRKRHVSPGKNCRLVAPIRGRISGPGELFASVLLGSIMQGAPFDTAVERAAAFTFRVIIETQKAMTPAREGVLFEKFLRELAE